MFDKLIVSEPDGSDIKNRRNYFMVSSFVVGVLFLAAVVFSIYAADFGLGKDNFELSVLMAPPEIAASEPEPPRPQSPATQTRSQSQLPTRRESVARVDEPTIVPTTTSTSPNTQLARPLGAFRIDTTDTNPSPTDGRISDGTDPGIGQSGISVKTDPVEADPTPEPPPVKKPDPKPTIIRSEGPVNGKATYLPKPPYPAAAVQLGLQTKVDVQVTIDEKGKVISANAVSGHKLFWAAAENAAWSARFSPTYLAKVPVKVTGVIIYNFTR